MRLRHVKQSINDLNNSKYLRFYNDEVSLWKDEIDIILDLPDDIWFEYYSLVISEFDNNLKENDFNLIFDSILRVDLKREEIRPYLNLFKYLKTKKSLYYYIGYLYWFYNYLFIYNYRLNWWHPSFYYFRGFYDRFFYELLFLNYLKYKYINNNYTRIFYNMPKNNLKVNFKNFANECFPSFNLYVITDLCFLLRPRNLFLMLTFYNRLFLLHTTGQELGHEGRKKQSIQVRSISNIIWHLFFRENCRNVNVKFLNFKNKAIYFLTLLTHIKYVKRFKNKPIKFIQFIFELKQQYGFLKGKKLAVRKRFVIRRRRMLNLNIDKYEKELKKKKCYLKKLDQFVLVYVIN